jgi:microcystin-dependent protein
MPSGQGQPGYVVLSGSKISPGGPTGVPGTQGGIGLNAFNTTASAFTVPPVGQTTTVTLNDASAGELQVTAKAGNVITVLTPYPPGLPGLASAAGPGLVPGLPAVSGSGSQTKTWLRGDNTFQPLPTDSYLSAGFTVPPVGNTVAVQFYGPPYPGWPSIGSGTVYVSDGTTRGFLDLTAYNSGSGQLTLTNKGAAPAGSGVASDALVRLDAPAQAASVPTGVVMDFAGATAPVGFLLCNGASYATASYPALFTVIGYTFGGSGANFNVPDLRSRVAVGAGQGSGLTNRTLGVTGGEETHTLVLAELASHTHGVAHTHTMGNHTHLGVDHLHSMQNHTHGYDHYHSLSAHTHYASGVDHLHSLQGHTHGYTSCALGAGGYQLQAQSGGAQVNNPAANTGGPSAGTTAASDRSLAFNTGGPSADNTNWASQESAGWGTSGGPSVGSTGAADRGLTTGGPSTNTTDGASIASTAGAGSDTAHNTMPPFLILNKIIKV